jgi:hypothetical protein
MRHLVGSLKNLAKGFAADFQMAKGHFPHLFNTKANEDYQGSLPDRDFFDMSFVAKSDKDLREFNVWYNERQASSEPWNLKEELIKYCDNDVEVLRCIALEYHKNILAITEMSPWGFSTAPSCAHAFIRKKVIMDYDLGSFSEDVDELLEQRTDLAKNRGWATLNTAEYFFARGALRGGRTDVRCYYLKLEEEEINRGVRIRYQDIVSQYPFQQVAHKFPVGVARIEVFDLEFKPCILHAAKLNRTGSGCGCAFPSTKQCIWKKPDELVDTPPTAEYILQKSKTMGGFIYADVTPPDDMYHPILIGFNAENNKAVASLERIKGHFTILEFALALEHGYTINKVYRIDWYTMKEGLWADCVKELYLQKMMYSNSLPSPEKQQQLIEEYEEHFGMGQIMRASFASGNWGKSAAKKMTAKIILNSGWGKHAQRPFMDESKVFSNREDISTLVENCARQNVHCKQINLLSEHYTKIVTKKNEDAVQPDLHDSYLPAAVYVPAYGRVQLWRELVQLGKRALYHDTDSIIYVYDPEEYNIPEGARLGQWEIEDVDKDNDGIIEFVAAGPKTYGFRTKENDVTVVKCKGIALTNSTQRIVNFETLKGNVQAGLNGAKEKLRVPQMFFKYQPGQGMVTFYDFKQFGFDPEAQKGFIHGAYQYPLGYNKDLL